MLILTPFLLSSSLPVVDGFSGHVDMSGGGGDEVQEGDVLVGGVEDEFAAGDDHESEGEVTEGT